MAKTPRVRPRTFFLNEKHELSREEKPGGGGLPKYAPIDWAAKGRNISRSLSKTRGQIKKSQDPLKESHFFLLSRPVARLQKLSDDRRKAPEGTYEEETDYAAEHSRVFNRLGLDLLQVNADGSAAVHATPERVEQMLLTCKMLEEAGAREQARWATLDRFEAIPLELRIDLAWLDSLQSRELTDAVIELQPLLTRGEVDSVLREIARALKGDANEAVTGSGADFSGRQWFRARVTPKSLRAIARDFFSVESLHSPLLSLAAAPRQVSTHRANRRTHTRATRPHDLDLAALPCVGILDTGVPRDHMQLAAYCRGQFIDPDSGGRPYGDHAPFVASRCVFGDLDYSTGVPDAGPDGGVFLL